MALTTEQRRRVVDALCETERFIEKQNSRYTDLSLRPAEIQQLLDFSAAHRLKLLGMLAN